jgi:hypothetical protein
MNVLFNKKFWEEPIAYFPLVRYGNGNEKFMGGYTDTQQDYFIRVLLFFFKIRKLG